MVVKIWCGFKIDFLGKPIQPKQEKPESAATTQKVKIVESNKDAKPKLNDDDDSDEDSDESTDDEDESSEDEVEIHTFCGLLIHISFLWF